MSLVVLTDTYISAADCEIYLAAHYITTDAKYIAWLAVSSPNREILLRQAAKIIDRQPLQGYLAVVTQAMQFPRILYTEYQSNVLNNAAIIQDENWYIQPSVPLNVTYAQCEIALHLAQGTSDRADLQRQGVKSFSLGNLSESYSGTKNPIGSHEAMELLAPFVGGGFRI